MWRRNGWVKAPLWLQAELRHVVLLLVRRLKDGGDLGLEIRLLGNDVPFEGVKFQFLGRWVVDRGVVGIRLFLLDVDGFDWTLV